MSELPNIVLVHGAWADGSCWSDVIKALQSDGYQVTAPQFPETSLAADVGRLRQVLGRQDGPTILVGHSYGGQIITALGADEPKVAGLVYIAAFALQEGESLGALLGAGPPTPALAHLIVDDQGTRGGLRGPFRRRRRAGESSRPVRGTAVPFDEHVRGRHG
jgi:pimeloyl-ACP methyl ester carboxylesterase